MRDEPLAQLATVEPDIMKCRRTGKITGLRYIRLFSIHFTITGLTNIVCYTRVFAISGFHYTFALAQAFFLFGYP